MIAGVPTSVVCSSAAPSDEARVPGRWRGCSAPPPGGRPRCHPECRGEGDQARLASPKLTIRYSEPTNRRSLLRTTEQLYSTLAALVCRYLVFRTNVRTTRAPPADCGSSLANPPAFTPARTASRLWFVPARPAGFDSGADGEGGLGDGLHGSVSWCVCLKDETYLSTASCHPRHAAISSTYVAVRRCHD